MRSKSNSPKLSSTKGHEASFLEIVSLIATSREKALQAANTTLIELYWKVGETISRKIEAAEWGDGVVDNLAEFIVRTEPGLRGFTRAEVVEAAFIELLDRLVPKPERMELLERVFRQSWVGRAQTAEAESVALRRELAKAEARKQRVLGQMADGVLSTEDFATLHKANTEAIAELRERLAVSEGGELDLETALGYLQHLLWNTSAIWQTSDLREKQRIQRRVFLMGWYGRKQALEHP